MAAASPVARSTERKGVNVVEEDGVEVFRLTSGDPNIYEGGWDTPRHMKDAVVKAVEDGYNMYPHRLEGLVDRLAESVAGWEKRINGVDYAPGDIITTQGVAGAIRLAFSLLMGPGDELLLTDPTYIPYKRVANQLGEPFSSGPSRKRAGSPTSTTSAARSPPRPRPSSSSTPRTPQAASTTRRP